MVYQSTSRPLITDKIELVRVGAGADPKRSGPKAVPLNERCLVVCRRKVVVGLHVKRSGRV